jgi:hypothetical protein
MHCNLGSSNRLGRVLASSAVFVFAIWSPTWIGLIGLPILFTALVGYCPLQAWLQSCRKPGENNVSKLSSRPLYLKERHLHP